MSGSGISWAICKSAPHSRQMTMPASHHSVFTGQMPLLSFLPPNRHRKSTEGHRQRLVVSVTLHSKITLTNSVLILAFCIVNFNCYYMVKWRFLFSLSSWHTLLERSRVHDQTSVFSRGCLLPRVGRTDVQWSQIRLNGSEPCVVGSSWRSFPVLWRLANRSSTALWWSSSGALLSIFKHLQTFTENSLLYQVFFVNILFICFRPCILTLYTL